MALGPLIQVTKLLQLLAYSLWKPPEKKQWNVNIIRMKVKIKVTLRLQGHTQGQLSVLHWLYVFSKCIRMCETVRP